MGEMGDVGAQAPNGSADQTRTRCEHAQAGIDHPRASDQLNQWVVRLNLVSRPKSTRGEDFAAFVNDVREGLRTLCTVLNNHKQSTYDGNFTATIGFGGPFFADLRPAIRTAPSGPVNMPSPGVFRGDPSGDNEEEYLMKQTAIIIVLAASKRSVLSRILGVSPSRNDIMKSAPMTIVNALTLPSNSSKPRVWAEITDVHEGFRRESGRNMLGFYDGLANPGHMSFKDVVWTQDDRLPCSTYLVFQKIVHNQDKWQALGLAVQEELVGRHKATGLLLGTFDDPMSKGIEERYGINPADNGAPPNVKEQDLADRLRRDYGTILDRAILERNDRLAIEQDPSVDVFHTMPMLDKHCPIWSHVRRANPRTEGDAHLLYRRGCMFYEDGPPPRSGILFLAYQNDIEQRFEHIMKRMLGESDSLPKHIRQAEEDVFTTLGGGYYFVPGIPPIGGATEIGQQFFH